VEKSYFCKFFSHKDIEKFLRIIAAAILVYGMAFLEKPTKALAKNLSCFFPILFYRMLQTI